MKTILLINIALMISCMVENELPVESEKTYSKDTVSNTVKPQQVFINQQTYYTY